VYQRPAVIEPVQSFGDVWNCINILIFSNSERLNEDRPAGSNTHILSTHSRLEDYMEYKLVLVYVKERGITEMTKSWRLQTVHENVNNEMRRRTAGLCTVLSA
jgi:hypothetical protein